MIRKQENTAVIVVDVQGDFTDLEQGSLAVAGTDRAYIDQVRAKTLGLKESGYKIFATQDWHPQDHISFFSNHKGTAPFETIKIEDRVQVLWPPHCVQETKNADLLVDTTLFDRIVKKGMDPAYDSYSGFFDDGQKSTGLVDALKNQGIQNLIIYGLTTDYCARATAMDALTLGFGVVLIKDLCRGVDPETTRAALENMAAAGVTIV
ncbi:MAG: isochorismatase family protein [Desulfobacter sp.]|nr:isochorismatase family protein [Desulfobacter sp.]WDP84143.1 MAG: isochorismatase family protein [Desulfobacter sp.]